MTYSTGDRIAGASGIALFVVMLVFDWFTVETVGRNAWEAFGIIDIVLFLAAVAGISLGLIGATDSRSAVPVSVAALTAALGALAVALIAFRLVSPPDIQVLGVSANDAGLDTERAAGVFLGLIAAAGVTYGGWVAMQEERQHQVDARRPPSGGRSAF